MGWVDDWVTELFVSGQWVFGRNMTGAVDSTIQQNIVFWPGNFE
jgi:hypothetical protein